MWICMFVAAMLAIVAYCAIVIAWTEKVKYLASLLKELLEATQWADIMALIKDEEYVSAVMDACGVILEAER